MNANIAARLAIALQKRLVVLTTEWLPWLQETVVKRSLFCIRGL